MTPAALWFWIMLVITLIKRLLMPELCSSALTIRLFIPIKRNFVWHFPSNLTENQFLTPYSIIQCFIINHNFNSKEGIIYSQWTFFNYQFVLLNLLTFQKHFLMFPLKKCMVMVTVLGVSLPWHIRILCLPNYQLTTSNSCAVCCKKGKCFI